MNKSFLNHEKPLLTAMMTYDTADLTIGGIRNAMANGAEAFGLQFEYLDNEYKNEDTYKRIFSEFKDKPVYVTNYRSCKNSGKTDEILAEEMLYFSQNGATLCDVMGDMFCRHEEELTDDKDAIEKQIKYIDKLHENGAEVLMSSHMLKYMSGEKVLDMALEQKRRGADIIKIVTFAENMEQQLENLKTTHLLKKELDAPFLFLSGGECSIHRRLGMKLGCCMCLCVHEHHIRSTATQPLLNIARKIRDDIGF